LCIAYADNGGNAASSGSVEEKAMDANMYWAGTSTAVSASEMEKGALYRS